MNGLKLVESTPAVDAYFKTCISTLAFSLGKQCFFLIMLEFKISCDLFHSSRVSAN